MERLLIRICISYEAMYLTCNETYSIGRGHTNTATKGVRWSTASWVLHGFWWFLRITGGISMSHISTTGSKKEPQRNSRIRLPSSRWPLARFRHPQFRPAELGANEAVGVQVCICQLPEAFSHRRQVIRCLGRRTGRDSPVSWQAWQGTLMTVDLVACTKLQDVITFL